MTTTKAHKTRMRALQKSKVVIDIKADLEQFIRSLCQIGEAARRSKILDTDKRKAMRQTVATLRDSTDALIKTIKRDDDLVDLWSALGSAFVIGSQAVMSDNAAAAAHNEKLTKAREQRAANCRSDPVGSIIRRTVDDHRQPGDYRHPWKAAETILADVNQALTKAGHAPLTGCSRIARYLKSSPDSPRS